MNPSLAKIDGPSISVIILNAALNPNLIGVLVALLSVNARNDM